jgi:hypothetical protein
MTLDGKNDKVGIGTISPLTRLQVLGSTISVGSQSTYAFGVGNGSNYDLTFGTDGSYAYIQSWTSKPLQINSQGNNVVFPSSNVGIGTTNPTNLLHIYSSPTAGAVRIGGGNGSGNKRIFIESGTTNYIDSYGDSAHKEFHINASPLLLNNSGNGRVGIAEGASTYSRLNVNGSTKINRSVYNWYQSYWTGNSTYWHMKTNMYGGAAGNTMYTMSLFKGYMYSYGNSGYYEGATAFHNWSGTIYNRASSGNLFSNVYNSSDGYIVLVIPSGDGEAGVTIDWHQAYAYPWVEAQVTAAGLHGATTGKY